MKEKLTITITLFILLGVAFPVLGFTPATTTQVQWPSSPMGTSLTPSTEFHVFIAYIYEWGISLGGIAVFVMLLWAGIQYLTSAGDPGKMSSAIKRIQSSILGLVLLLTSWLILNTINPQLVKLDPLPEIWSDQILPEFNIDPSDMQAPPCDFAVVWPEERFGGEPRQPVKFDSEEDEVKRIEGSGALSQYSDPWASAKSFIRLTPEEIALLDRDNDDDRLINIQRYDGDGNEDDGGLYKEGGLCMIDLFYTTRKWFQTDACGGRLARVQLESRDLTESKYRDEAITCAELIRSLPK